MEIYAISQFHLTHFPLEKPSDVTITIPFSGQLDFIYYAIVRERFGQIEILFEYSIEEGTTDDFSITLPIPSDPISQWSIQIYGYQDNQRVLSIIKNAQDVF